MTIEKDQWHCLNKAEFVLNGDIELKRALFISPRSRMLVGFASTLRCHAPLTTLPSLGAGDGTLRLDAAVRVDVCSLHWSRRISHRKRAMCRLPAHRATIPSRYRTNPPVHWLCMFV